MKPLLACVLCFLTLMHTYAQTKTFTHADTLRGSITPERAWWDVQRYDISVTPDYNNKTIIGSSAITYLVTSDNKGRMMQLDLQEPLIIDSILFIIHQRRQCVACAGACAKKDSQ